MLDSFFPSMITNDVTIIEYIFYTCYSLLLGLVIALIHMYKNRYTKNFILTLVIIPSIVQVVIMLINGNIGTGVAVVGAFSLIRFSSVPGNSKEIAFIFFSMATGLAIGTGFPMVALLMVLIIGSFILFLKFISFGQPKYKHKKIKIQVSNKLDYIDLFDDIMKKYTLEYYLLKISIINNSENFELEYVIQLKNKNQEKQFLDEIRIANENLPISYYYENKYDESL